MMKPVDAAHLRISRPSTVPALQVAWIICDPYAIAGNWQLPRGTSAGCVAVAYLITIQCNLRPSNKMLRNI